MFARGVSVEVENVHVDGHTPVENRGRKDCSRQIFGGTSEVATGLTGGSENKTRKGVDS